MSAKIVAARIHLLTPNKSLSGALDKFQSISCCGFDSIFVAAVLVSEVIFSLTGFGTKCVGAVALRFKVSVSRKVLPTASEISSSRVESYFSSSFAPLPCSLSF